VRSLSLWDRRITIVSTFAFIRENDVADTLKLTERLLGDEHDLIHKARGWMLREVGKRDLPALERFLRRHHEARLARCSGTPSNGFLPPGEGHI
jgi:3-methyladenine DNA glycosylase AlkD